jgi:dTDP-4-amino-4,6-dideoxygalactose transaminase
MTDRPVPLLDLSQQHRALRQELLSAFERVLDSGHFILGGEVTAFEKELATALGAKHAIAMSSGSDALLAALMAIPVGPGDEVITTAYSFFATAGCVARLGATPVFVDVQPDTLNIDPAQVEQKITPRTKVIMPVHLFGLPADMAELMASASEHGIVVLEDACQAIGARYHGRAIGTIGHMAAFSFFPSKNLGGFGDGGLITTEDDDRAGQLRMLRAHGSRVKYHHDVIGGNFRLDALQAALLRVKVPHLASWTAARRANAARYAALFVKAGVKEIAIPPQPKDRTHVFHQYVIRTARRDALRAHLAERQIGTEVYYPVPLHRQRCFSSLEYSEGSLPHSERACAETLALPIFPEMTEAQQEAVVTAIAEFYARAA